MIFLQLSIPDKLLFLPIPIWLLHRDHIYQRQRAGIKNRDGRLSLGFNSCDASRAQLVKIIKLQVIIIIILLLLLIKIIISIIVFTISKRSCNAFFLKNNYQPTND